MTDELKPCPFCRDPMEWTVGDYLRHRIQTPGCPIAQNGFADLAAWNRRADHIVDAAEMAPPALDAALIKSKASGTPIPMDKILATAKAKPAGDLVKAIGNTIEKAWDECQDLPPIEFCDHEKEYIARAILALFQPQMEAAEGLLRAAMAAVSEIPSSSRAANRAAINLCEAIEVADAAGLGRESHD